MFRCDREQHMKEEEEHGDGNYDKIFIMDMYPDLDLCDIHQYLDDEDNCSFCFYIFDLKEDMDHLNRYRKIEKKEFNHCMEKED